MRGVEERSPSSILRSKLLTTLINNDVSEKLNAGGRLSALDKFQAVADVFRVRIGAGTKPRVRNLLTRKI